MILFSHNLLICMNWPVLGRLGIYTVVQSFCKLYKTLAQLGINECHSLILIVTQREDSHI